MARPLVSHAQAEPTLVYPADAGHLNVRDFGAIGNGVTDDTVAINAALAASGGDTGRVVGRDRIVYLPNGTYRVSAPLLKRYAPDRYASGVILIGESRSGTVLQLADNSPGYTDPKAPRAVVFTTSRLVAAKPAGRDYAGKGEGNDAYMNGVENLTIDVGSGNPGAIGIDYLANNLGAVRNVLIRAAAGSGATGISMRRRWPGPALLRGVVVEGFAVGIDVAQTEYGVTLEGIRLLRQREAGLRNEQNMVAVHDLTVEGAPVAICNRGDSGLIVVADGLLRAASGRAFENAGALHLRNVRVEGYQENTMLDGVYEGMQKVSRARQSWSLRIKQAPRALKTRPSTWLSVTSLGARGDGQTDSTEAIQRALSSGREVIYFPHGEYLISDQLIIPSSVRTIIGMTSTIVGSATMQPGFRREHGIVRVENDKAPLTIERLTIDNTKGGAPQIAIEAVGSHPLVVRDVFAMAATLLRRPATSKSELFLEDVCCSNVIIEGRAGVWARQLNSEGRGIRVSNDGAPMWILGLKTERNGTVLKNTNGARTEVIGALIYMVEPPVPEPVPAFINQGSKLLLSYVEEALFDKNTYAVHLLTYKRGKPHRTTRADLLPRGAGRLVPLLVADDD